VGSALGSGHVAVVIATRAHRDELHGRLTAVGVNVNLARKQGRYVALDAADTLAKFMVEAKPDATRFETIVGGVLARAIAAGRHANPRVAAFGEMVALLWAAGNSAAAIELERLWNGLAEVHSFHLQCAYPMRLFPRGSDAALLGSVCAEHSHVMPTEHFMALADTHAQLREVALLQQKAQALEAEIEDRKALEQTLVERNRELREAVHARDEFLSVAAHELRTPITGLCLTAQSLLIGSKHGRAVTPERLLSALSTIETQTEKLNRLIARLLDHAQIGANKLQIEPVLTDLSHLLQTTLAERPSDPTHPIVFDGPDHLELSIDPLRFEQVIINLVENAMKFSPEGGEVSVALTVQDQAIVQLTVTDHGIGIAADERDRIFQRFHQAHTESHLAGLGLGLSITREIVSLHGGEIRVEEPEHPGARFVIRLPMHASAA
jgi:signal transduction histidine kinase